jgi:hypothetical protein
LRFGGEKKGIAYKYETYETYATYTNKCKPLRFVAFLLKICIFAIVHIFA